MKLLDDGFQIENAIFSEQEVSEMIHLLKVKGFEDSFGVRDVLGKIPELQDIIFSNKKFREVIHKISPDCCRSIKSIYFNKPPRSNWIVNWHQDLTVNLEEKVEIEGGINWRQTGSRFSMQPPLRILEDVFTLRIHLDDASIENGALKVVRNSHSLGIVDIVSWKKEFEDDLVFCLAKSGDVVAMKPLIIHASSRTENLKNRRVLHIEFCSLKHQYSLPWKEKILF